MSKSNTFENEFLNLVLNNSNIPNIGDATGLRGSTAAGNLYIALHTADPGEAGTATTNEATYTGYARKAVSRGGGEWTVASGAATNANAQTFAACTGGTNTITHFSVVKEVSGASVILFSGALTASLAVAAGITPSFAAGQLTINED